MAYHFESIRIGFDGPSYNNLALVDQRKLYICSLSPETTTEFLLHFFRKYGEIEEGSIAFEKDSNRSRGFGFVTYKTMEAAQKAILDPGKKLCGRFEILSLTGSFTPMDNGVTKSRYGGPGRPRFSGGLAGINNP